MDILHEVDSNGFSDELPILVHSSLQDRLDNIQLWLHLLLTIFFDLFTMKKNKINEVT